MYIAMHIYVFDRYNSLGWLELSRKYHFRKEEIAISIVHAVEQDTFFFNLYS